MITITRNRNRYIATMKRQAISKSIAKFMIAAITVATSLTGVMAADRRLLWPEGAPMEKQFAEAENNPARPTLDHFPASRWTTGAAVIICPGGGYENLATAHEGQQIAQWFNEQGVVAFVLRYRHAPEYHYPAPVLDVQRAVRWVRFHAKECGINTNMIGVLGFSAGGHLASTAATHFDFGDPTTSDPIDRVSCRPDFAILCYPVISFVEPYTHQGSRRHFFGTNNPPEELARQFSNERQVTTSTPPTFLFHTDEDKDVPAENSIAFYLALRKANVPAELHTYRPGRHGGGLWPGDPMLGDWPRQTARWMHGLGLMNWPAVGWDPSPSLPSPVTDTNKP